LFSDRNRDDLAAGLSEKELLAKFPFLVSGEIFEENGYKWGLLQAYKMSDEKAVVLWFTDRDGFDWCIVVLAVGNRVSFVKG